MSCRFVFTLFWAFCIFITVLSGTTDILLQPEVYSAVNLTEWKLVCKFAHMYQEPGSLFFPSHGTGRREGNEVGIKSSTYVKPIGIIIKNLDHASRIFCLILSCNFLLQSGQVPVDEPFWKSYCVDTDPSQWPCITKFYLKETS